MGDLGRALALAEQRSFLEAAAEAREAAGTAYKRGFRVHAFDAYGAAGKFYHMGGDHAAALVAFDQAFQLLEHDLTYYPRAVLLIRRLSSWPELYARAALSALETGDAARAVTLAESGRSRAIAQRIGPAAHSPPPKAAPEIWERYVRAWRTAVAIAANELVDEDKWLSRADTKHLDAELTELRSELLDAGVPPEEMTPVARAVDAAQVVERLRLPELSRTCVLYTVRLDDQVLRFIRLSRDGAAEIVLDPEDQQRVLKACDRHLHTLREEPAEIHSRIGGLLSELLREIAAPLGSVLERSLERESQARLLWIPQGSLVGIPISACPVGDGMLVDRAAVLVAPSLTAGMAALAADCSSEPRACSIKGRKDPRDPPTDGGDILVRLLDPDSPLEVLPKSLDELSGAVRDSSLVHVTCHGVYDWNDPLSSYLKLGQGFDLSVEALFGAESLVRDRLVLLGACDSGTAAQTDINEAIGVPMAFMGAGAHAVVGATWPVARIAAIVICMQFLRYLKQGLSSPEALRRACRWLRDASLREIHGEISQIGHPVEPVLKAALSVNAGEKAYAHPRFWASYVHWGGGWQAAQV